MMKKKQGGSLDLMPRAILFIFFWNGGILMRAAGKEKDLLIFAIASSQSQYPCLSCMYDCSIVVQFIKRKIIPCNTERFLFSHLCTFIVRQPLLNLATLTHCNIQHPLSFLHAETMDIVQKLKTNCNLIYHSKTAAKHPPRIFCHVLNRCLLPCSKMAVTQ